MYLSLVYVSSATINFTEEDLLQLLEKSRRNNEQCDVTGLLLYHDGNFFQVIEGEPDAVEVTYDRIVSDPRHGGEIILLKQMTTERSFPNWAMGFKNIDLLSLEDKRGFSEILKRDWDSTEFRQNPSRVQRLVLSFRDQV